MSLPYRWRPMGTRTTYGKMPEVGALVAFEHAVYRVIEVRDRPDEERPHDITLRPVAVSDDDPKARDHDISGTCGAHVIFNTYKDEHYPICAKCLEPLPCREQMVERVTVETVKRAGRYELAGVCPVCAEVVTTRQKSITFSENLEVIFGPPVTFHLRNQCHWSATEYEKRWVAADPQKRKATFSCIGHVTNHNDGTYDCTELNDCPGPQAGHPSYSCCRCPDCHSRGVFQCHPRPTAKRNGGHP